MNCVRCNMPLEENARFCRNCGQPVANRASLPELKANGASGKASPSPLYQPVSNNTEAATIPPTPWQAPPNTPQQPPLYLSGQPGQSVPAQSVPAQQWPQQQNQQQAQQWPQQQNQQTEWRPSQTPPFVQSDKRNDLGNNRSGPANQPQQKTRRKRRGRGLLIGFAVVIVLIVALLIGGRFALNAFAINQINQALSDAINNIPPEVALLPERDQTISEGTVNSLISLKSSSPVQNLTVHFTPNDMEIDFNVFSSSSTITAVPKIVNGQFVVTNVTVNGLAGLILSPDDLTNLMNTQITNLETHIQHTITADTLQNHAILLHIKPNSSTPTKPGTLPTSIPTTIPTGLPTLPSIP